jgi:tRNA(Ile)-lysidine synthase
MVDVIDLLQNELKISKNTKLIISVSGGADSMLLLSMLKESSYKIEVVHFNHMKRQQSKIEADLVRSYCQENDIPFHYYLIEIDEGNFHHQAHKMRLHYLKDVAKVAKAKYILTAHHLDDLLENILIKLTRGSNLLGYAGMQLSHTKKGITYVKPLLYTSKKEILDYVSKHNIPFLDDESNEENYYLRNRYRHAIIPIMKQENLNLLSQAKNYHQQLTKAFNFIRNTTLKTLNQTQEIDIKVFKTLDVAIQEDMIAYLLEEKQINTSYEIIIATKHMILNDKPNQVMDLSNQYQFIKAYDKSYVSPKKTEKHGKYEVKNGETKLPNNVIFTFLDNSNTHTEDLEKLCYNKLAFPLWIRHRQNGDKLAYNFGHKKLKDLLIDKKIPMEKRNTLWVLTDSENNILWVQDLYLNQTLGKHHTIYFKLKETKHA